MSVRIMTGDVREQLRILPPDHFDCVVTSPPYWGLRDYGIAGQIGQEPTLGEHLRVMVEVFSEVRRVMKPPGTLWLNYGDCYATTPNGRSAAATKEAGNDDRTFRDKPFSTVGPIFQGDHGTKSRVGTNGNKSSTGADYNGRIVAGGVLKPKDLCMIPNRLAIALQDDGWWVRSEIIWGKPNAMPDSSGRYRPATAHEKIFLLAKSDQVDWWIARDTGEISASPDLSERCAYVSADGEGPRWTGLGHYYNAEAVRVKQAASTVARLNQDLDNQPGSARANGGAKTNGAVKAVGRRQDKQRGHSRRHQGFNDGWDAMDKSEQQANGRLLRNYEPAPLTVWEMATAAFKQAHFATFPPELVERCLNAGCPPGGKVLDPFGGAGTTGMVADRMGLDAVMIEINPAYAELAKARIVKDSPLFAEVTA